MRGRSTWHSDSSTDDTYQGPCWIFFSWVPYQYSLSFISFGLIEVLDWNFGYLQFFCRWDWKSPLVWSANFNLSKVFLHKSWYLHWSRNREAYRLKNTWCNDWYDHTSPFFSDPMDWVYCMEITLPDSDHFLWHLTFLRYFCKALECIS